MNRHRFQYIYKLLKVVYTCCDQSSQRRLFVLLTGNAVSVFQKLTVLRVNRK